MLKTIVHYSLHFLAPLLLTYFFSSERRKKAFLIMLATMAVDLDHLLADPIFDPGRMSIGFHPLHSYVAVVLYFAMCFVPYEKLGWPWCIRAVGIGLAFHMFTDWQDGFLW